MTFRLHPFLLGMAGRSVGVSWSGDCAHLDHDESYDPGESFAQMAVIAKG